MQDSTRGCCKFCGRDLEPGQICDECLALGLHPSHVSIEALAAQATAECAYLVEFGTRRPIQIGSSRYGIGRHPGNELRLDDAYVSRYHARITLEGKRYYLEDLGSTNGTLLNACELTSRRQLHHGDRVRIGKSDFIFAEKDNQA